MKPSFLLVTAVSASAASGYSYMTSPPCSHSGSRVVHLPHSDMCGRFVSRRTSHTTATRRRPFSRPRTVQYKSTAEDTTTSSVDDEDWDDTVVPASPSVDPPPGAPSDAEVEDITMEWIKRAVIGLNLCPFAERPLKTGELSLHVTRGNDPRTISEAVAEQLLRKRDERGTAFVITPEFCADDFDEYMTMVQFLEERVMTYHDLHGRVQIAAFHPDFAFDGSGEDAVDVYTNRSPYPAFHVLREDEVVRAGKKLGGDSGRVWRRNKRLLEILDDKLGRLGVVKLLLGRGRRDGKKNEDEDDTHKTNGLVEEAMAQTRMEMETEDEEGGENS
mmetsp:Transcript_36058/g.73192  ORF Transcript_36058/g.73192 Transcript_36058/m.73192 type:complete len:331 (+) Transcript_36058:1207-2199(+)|eukprot:CAMPEP_0178567766 /NCGR_PEP_ID=MMETSP0697-20121206/15512_1 /TAXON_ID=265572 /ORGANISM="Extubocellulus spinifer, Strain CCMP396" /LENGTH=330 /DNA_ID=CAMNT_0020201745 /DNA_START=32 /DNA_END=1024 /DNA_ORIENTATION=+